MLSYLFPMSTNTCQLQYRKSPFGFPIHDELRMPFPMSLNEGGTVTSFDNTGQRATGLVITYDELWLITSFIHAVKLWKALLGQSATSAAELEGVAPFSLESWSRGHFRSSLQTQSLSLFLVARSLLESKSIYSIVRKKWLFCQSSAWLGRLRLAVTGLKFSRNLAPAFLHNPVLFLPPAAATRSPVPLELESFPPFGTCRSLGQGRRCEPAHINNDHINKRDGPFIVFSLYVHIPAKKGQSRTHDPDILLPFNLPWKMTFKCRWQPHVSIVNTNTNGEFYQASLCLCHSEARGPSLIPSWQNNRLKNMYLLFFTAIVLSFLLVPTWPSDASISCQW